MCTWNRSFCELIPVMGNLPLIPVFFGTPCRYTYAVCFVKQYTSVYTIVLVCSNSLFWSPASGFDYSLRLVFLTTGCPRKIACLCLKTSRGPLKWTTNKSWVSFEKFRKFRNFVFLPKNAWDIGPQSWLPSSWKNVFEL